MADDKLKTAEGDTTPAAASTTQTKKKNSGVRRTVLLIVIVALVGVIGYYFGSNLAKAPSTDPPKNFVALPTVSSSLTSSKDGKSHSIDIDFTIEYNNNAEDSISHNDAYSKVRDAVSSLDYEALKQENSIDYIEASVKESLGDLVAPEDIANVYIGNIAIDFPGIINSQNSAAGSSDKRLKGLFKNLE